MFDKFVWFAVILASNDSARGHFFSGQTCWVWHHHVEGMSLKYTNKSETTQSSCCAFNQKLLCYSESVAITPEDARWVGAWWIGFLISSGLMFISAIPFWFLPRSPLKPEEDKSRCGDKDGAVAAVSSDNNLKLADIAKSWGNPLLMCLSAQIKTLSQCSIYIDWSDVNAFLPAEFFPSLKHLLETLVYCLFLCGSILKFNAIIGQITYMPKYMEQQFGLSTTRANFLVGKKEYIYVRIYIHDSISFDVFPFSTLQTWGFTGSKARLQKPLQTACFEYSIHLLSSNSYQEFLPFSSRCVESASGGVGDLTWRAGDETLQTKHGVWSSALLSHLLHRLPADAAVF